MIIGFQCTRYFRLSPIHAFLICFTLCLPLTWSCSHKNSLSRNDALGSLKMLNSDMVNLSDAGSERPEMRVLNFIWKQKSAPVPFKSDSSFAGLNRKSFGYEAKKGVYVWNSRSNTFVRIKDTTVIVLRLPVPDDASSRAVFVIKQYEEKKINSRPDFPVLMDAQLLINGKTALRLLHKAVIEESLPRFINTKMIGKGYSADFYLKREGKSEDKDGKLEIRLQFIVKGKRIIDAKIKAAIQYNGPTYFFNGISLGVKLFDVGMEGDIDYKHIDPTSNNYSREFNRHSNIALYNMNLGRKIGDVMLEKSPEDDKVDYYVKFSDKSEEKLQNQLIILKKLINLKY